MIQVGMFSTPPPPIPQGKPPPPPMGGGGAQFQPLSFKPFKAPDGEFDGKRLRKSVMRKTVDYNCSVVNMLECRVWQRDERDRSCLQADVCYASEMLPPPAYPMNPINAVVSKFVRTSTNKAKCPIFCLAWTPEGRRLVTGASSGEFTLWNGLTFNFETILQAHDSSVRTMVWSHNDQWMVTGDTGGFVKYWQTNMNNVKLFQAHKDPVRGLSFSPSDQKFATGSDDGTVRIWDFYRCYEEKVLRGHGADVKCVDWHPSKSLLASGSKDNQQPIKLWDPRSGQPLAKLHAHKSTVMDLKWNANGNWLCSASRDHLLKLFDIRNLSTEFQVFRGHKKEASCIAWHPHHEGLFASGGSDGSILFWHVGNDKEVGAIESAHDGIIWDLAWHPLGHILCSGSNDHTSKFWTRNRPGDKMRDKYNLNTLPAGVLADDSMDIDDIPLNSSLTSQGAIPGMGPDDKIEETETAGPETIPGLDFEGVGFDRFSKKTPYAKPIPKTFQAAWNAAGGLEEEIEEENSATSWVVTDSAALFCMPANIEGEMVYTDDGDELPPGSVPLNNIKANSILYCGFLIPLEKVAGDVIQNAFATMEEEDAIAEITGDFEFARKLIKEKNQLLNPNASEEPPEKKGGPQFGEQKNPNYGNSNNNTGNYQGSAGFQGMQQPFGGGPSGPHNPNSQRGSFRGQFDGGFNRGGPRGNWSHRGSGPRGGHNMGGMRDGGEQYEEGFDEDWGYDEQGMGGL
ncbi:pre-mRNA 3' end processing protein WDR33-like [Penaeus monodon]|uniref:pre-mRNA 3' end processing protein WDR33-like n=1 Tax=Penaeus monodon TaxID=6687 RepID=UPI0018A7DE4E|nr:pre-mRNA 3' end processing protein WDR33-like [Penaeus monodon]